MRRHKPIIPALIGVGAGIFFLGMSVSNLVQTSHPQKEVALVANTSAQFSNRIELHGAHIARLTSNQIRIGEQLSILQSSLDTMIPCIESHSYAINQIIGGMERLYNQLQHAFLYSSVTHILRNELNLGFFAIRFQFTLLDFFSINIVSSYLLNLFYNDFTTFYKTVV